jgi:anhydro-N-acetylmuramic acid kinase
MSGTSLDGIDAALVRISGPATQPRVRLVAFETMPYPDEVRERLLAIAGGDSTTAGEIDRFNTLLGVAFGEAAIRVCRRARVKPARLFVVGSHGQTIHHCGVQPRKPTHRTLPKLVELLYNLTGTRRKPDAHRPAAREVGELFSKLRARIGGTSRAPGQESINAINLTYFPEIMKTLKTVRPVRPKLWSMGIRGTMQIAEPALIAERTGAPVVADFRAADMAAGGQGAPLVPIVDYLLLRDARKGTVALNIGGIANFTVIPAGAKPEQVFGFDTGPGNMVIDGLVRHLTKGKKAYDAGGRWAAKGQVIEPLLEEILRLPFFAQKPPKSAGREQFGQAFINQYFLRLQGDAASPLQRPLTRPAPAGENAGGGPPSPQGRGLEIKRGRGARPEDLLRTATELTARTIADALRRFVLGKIAIHRLIISGGGAHNRLLVTRLAELLPNLRLHRSDEFGINVDAKEAIAFAVLADRTMHGLPGNLPSVTGARHPVVLGKISRP